MDGLVFAAGEGTRLRPITNETPKPLLEVGGKPILIRCLEELVDLGAERLIVVVGYRGGDVVDAVGDAFRGVPVEYARQRERDGMAHAALAAADLVDGDVVLMDGDALFDCDLSPLVARHREPDVDGTLLFERVSPEAARSKAVLELDADGTIRRIENKPDDPPDSAPVAAGFQTATPALFDACRRVERSPRGEYELAAAIERAIDEGERIVGVECEGWHANVNTPADLEAAREHFS